MNIVRRAVAAVRGEKETPVPQEDKPVIAPPPTTAQDARDARRVLDSAHRLKTATEAADKARARFWQEVEHADQVMQGRR